MCARRQRVKPQGKRREGNASSGQHIGKLGTNTSFVPLKVGEAGAGLMGRGIQDNM